MPKTLSSLTAEALHDDFDASKYTTTAQSAIQDGLKRIARTVDLPLLRTSTTITLVSGTPNYALPSDFAYLRSVTEAGTGRALSPMTEGIDEYDRFAEATPVPTGKPLEYLVEGSELLLSPKPNAAGTLRVRYNRLPAELSDSVYLSSAMPEDYGYLVVAYARARLFRFEDDPEMAEYWQGQFDTWLPRLRVDLQGQHRTVERVGGYLGNTPPTFHRP